MKSFAVWSVVVGSMEANFASLGAEKGLSRACMIGSWNKAQCAIVSSQAEQSIRRFLIGALLQSASATPANEKSFG